MRRLLGWLMLVQLVTSASAFAFAWAFAPRLLSLGEVFSGRLVFPFVAGFVVHLSVLWFGVVREVRHGARFLDGDLERISPIDVLTLNRIGLRLVGYTLGGAVLTMLVITCVPYGGRSVSDRVLIALCTFNAQLGAHIVGYVDLRRWIAREIMGLPPAIVGRAARVHGLLYSKFGSLPVHMASAVCGSVYLVAQGALLQTAARVRATLELERQSIEADLQALGALSADAGVVEPPPVPNVMLAPLLVGFAITLLVSLLALVIGLWLGRSYAAQVRRVTAELRAMEDAQEMSDGLVDSTLYLDVTELLLAVGELSHLFHRFAAAKRGAARSHVHTERMRAQFLTAMSHDLKAPMNAVLGFAELLSQHPLTDGQRESVTIIQQRGEELLLLIRTVLDSARLEAESFVIEPEEHVLEELVQRALAQAEALGHEGGGQFARHLEERHRVRVDSERMQFALLLLLRTAQRLTSAGHQIDVRISTRSAGEVTLTIESSGGTLSQEEQSRVFRAFHHTADARKFGSLGLGLSLAQAIVAMCHGKVVIASQPGGALAMRVVLPEHRSAA